MSEMVMTDADEVREVTMDELGAVTAPSFFCATESRLRRNNCYPATRVVTSRRNIPSPNSSSPRAVVVRGNRVMKERLNMTSAAVRDGDEICELTIDELDQAGGGMFPPGPTVDVGVFHAAGVIVQG